MVSVAASIMALLKVSIVVAASFLRMQESVAQRSAEDLFDCWFSELNNVQTIVSFLSNLCFSELQFQLAIYRW